MASTKLTEQAKRRWHVQMVNGDTFVWEGTHQDISNLIFSGHVTRWMTCVGHTLVNLEHVAYLRPM